MKPYREPTHTKLVVERLAGGDDFLSVEDLIYQNCGTRRQVWQTLLWLRKSKVVDCVVNGDGKSWWFLLPRELDTRTRTIVERKPETKPRKKAKVAVPKESV